MEVYIRIDGETITDAKFRTFGCGSAIATTSMTTEMVKGMSLEDAMKLTRQDVAEELALQTMMGAGFLMQKSDKTPAELRRMVTSPGGTTAEALLQFEKGGFSDLITQAVRAAYDKARKLGS